MSNLVEGIAISGEFVGSLKDRHFVVLKAPRYEEVQDLDNVGQTKRKLVMFVEVVEDKSQLDYYPNKTSIKTMANMWGFNMDNWIGKVGEWEEPATQKVMGQTKKVLFVKFNK